MPAMTEASDSGNRFDDREFAKNNAHIAESWVSIKDVYPEGASQPLLPDTFSREQFGQGNHYECFMLSALSALVNFPEIIRNCFITKKVRQDGRYTFQFFRGREWVKVEIDDKIAMEDNEVLYATSPTAHWWPLLLEKAYAKFYTSYDHLEGCTLQETFHDLTGNPVLNIPMDAKLAKAANCEVTAGSYWIDLAQKIRTGEYVASALTKDVETENIGLQSEQQYGILEIFSLTGTSSLTDIVIHLHNPFEDEEFIYSGPLNPSDAAWTPKLRSKYDVENPRSIFLPLNHFLKMMNSMQLCFINNVEREATYYLDAWQGETAGGNPTSATWRKNPLYYISNLGTEPAKLSFVIKQEDQRRFNGPEVEPTYKQCGMILSQYVYTRPIPTFWVTGNNHKPIHKSLFLNSREVANAVTVPPNSLCYLVPSCMLKGEEAKFNLAVYRMSNVDYSNITIRKLDIPEMDWANPIRAEVVLQMRTKDRVDFYVEEATDVHILMHQEKPYISSKTGGDAMAQDYMGMYLYDDTDRKVSGVHAATNFRETSILHTLPRSGRYALSVTCPRGKGDVPSLITIVTSKTAVSRRVDTPEDATMLPDENDEIEEGGDETKKANTIDYDPINLPVSHVTEAPDSNTPFEDRRFMVDNHIVTKDPWVHIRDLYPEGKTQPLMPLTLSRDQFEQGEHFECCCLTAFAALVDNHPDVIRKCFVTKAPRKDGRYTFQFHRYGQWHKIEIDDRIPQVDSKTLFCRSPTKHWWPLLLEKAFAKFYTLYQNLEGCTQQELLHDLTGLPVVSIPTSPDLARSASFAIDAPSFWLKLRDQLKTTAAAALSNAAEHLGMNDDQAYAILDIVPSTSSPASLADIIVKLHNPYVDAHYTGPLYARDSRWPAAAKAELKPEAQNVICMPANVFCKTFLNIQQLQLKGLVEPSWNFNSEWGEGTSGGNPTLVTWRENPLYVVRNPSNSVVELVVMARQPDKRHVLHTFSDGELTYIQCGLVLSQSQESTEIPTYLVTGNNHIMVHKGLFLNAREVANRVLVPPQSLCYLVPSAMHHEEGMFMLSYWYTSPTDSKKVPIKRLQVDVARRLPAVAHVTLTPGGKDRVDFIVDCPTDAHILLSHLKTTKDAVASDAMTRDFLGMYLYDEKDARVTGVSAATNFRETGFVTRLPKPGRYALSITCPQGEDPVPCRVEVVCTEPAHVRITDPPEDAVGFDDLEEEDVKTAAVPFDNDRFITGEPAQAGKESAPVHGTSTAASRAVDTPEASQQASLARNPDLGFLDDEYLGIPKGDLDLLANPAFLEKAKQREALKKNPSANASHINALEQDMHTIAKATANGVHEKERGYLDKEPEGVPLDLLPLNEDPLFSAMEDELRALAKEPVKNAKAVKALQDKLNDRAHELAKHLKEAERDLFLDPVPLGVPVAMLPLDEDPVFHTKEVERLRERQKEHPSEAKVRAINDKLNDRAEELARQRLADNRDYLAPEHLRVANADLPLNDNKDFVLAEGRRQELMQDPKKNADAIAAFEDRLNSMAKDMAADFLAKLRPQYLQPEYHGRATEDLPLNENDEFLQKERELRDTMKMPRPDGKKIKALEDALDKLANDRAKAINADDRKHYMRPSYRGIPREELPLDTDPQITELEAERARLKREPNRNKEAIQRAEDAINARADELAKGVLRGNRSYLDPNPEGVPLMLLPLDEDPEFRRLEDERLDLLGMSTPPSKALAAIEDKLNDRARQLAKDFKAVHRPKYTRDIDPDDDSENSFDDDLPFVDMEKKMLSLLAEDPVGNRDQIEDLQDALFKRSVELERQRKQRERGFLDPYPLGIPLDEIGLDNNPEFLALEDKLRQARKANDPNLTAPLEEAMQKRAYELAAKELQRRRPYILSKPANVPLADLPEIGRDEPFWTIAADLDAQLANSPRMDKKKIDDLQKQMNDRLVELVKEKKKRERQFLDQMPKGIPIDDLDLDENKKFTEMEAERNKLLKENPRKNAAKINDLEEQMQAIVNQLADAAKWADRESYLDAYPEGVPLRAVPLDESPKFLEAEAQRRRLIEEDPRKNAKKIAELQQQLNDLAHELAKQKLWQDRKDNLDHNPEGMPLEGVGLDVDPEFRELEAEWQRLADEDPRKNAKQLEELRKAMNERAHELAKAKKQAERERVLGGDAVDDVPLEDLGLDEDAKFAELEAEQREVTKDPRKNAKRLQEVEQAMRDRARELADAAKWADRESYLDAYPEGVPLRAVPLDESPKFLEAEAQRRRLIEEDPRKNAKKIAELQQQLNDLAHELAKQKLWQDRKDNLDHNPEGMPLEGVGLDVDPEFRELEAEWQRLADEDPRKNAKQLEELRKAMNERAHELAKAKKQAERERVLGGDAVDDVPLEDLGLDEDAKFAELEAEQREVTKDPRKNAKRLQEVEQAMRDRARELADAAKWADRESYLDAYPEGVPLRAVPLDESPKFLEAEAQRRRLIEEDPRKNAKKIAELQKQLNDLAHELAKQKLWQDRKDNLDHNPEGMPLEGVGLDVDPEFRELEAEWQRLADEDPRKNAKQLEELRKAMNERAHELAKAKKQAERERVLGGDAVDDVPLEDLGLDEDAKFAELEAEQREVTKDPRKNAKRLQEVEQAMRDRARELADAAKWADRESYLDAYPEGVPLRAVPLDESPKFLEAEAQRRRLIEEDPRKNAKKIAELQKQLNDLAHELAKQKLWQDRKDNLDHNPEGMPLEGVGLDVDPEFRELEAEWQRLADEDPRKNAKQLEELRKAMNERAHELAKAKKQAERERVLGGDAVDDVPLEDLGLDEDAKFAELEAEQREVTKDPRKNAKRLQEVEQAMRDRARELADAAKWADRESYLDAYPEGVPLRAVPLDESPKFLEAEAQRRRLIEEDPRKNAKKIAELQQQLNDLAHELAKQKLWQDRKDNLDHNPEGMPLEGVGLDVDPEFRELEAEWQRLADEDPRKNAKQLEELRKAMNERAHELAKAKKQAERERVLGGDAVDDVPLEDLGLDEDAKFAELEAEQREVTKDPRKNAKRLQEVEQAMRDRARELADAAKWADRESYLDAYPEGVPLRAVPLDESPKFLEAEAQRRRLIEEDPRKNAKKIAELQQQLNDLAHELAKQKLWQDRKDNLDHNPEGMPLEGVGLDVDPEFRELEAEWQRLADEDPRKNAKQLEELRKAMNERAHELAKAKKQAERERVLGGDAVDDVPLEDLGLDEDAKFAELEAEQREVTKDPRKNAKRLQEVEQAMRDRARELADAAKWADRESYLDAYPEGVPLRAVPLDESPKFLEAEAQRRRLIEEDPRKNAKKIAELQKQLNDLAHELAKQKLWQDRKDNLDHNPEGMPLEGVGLDVDPEFRELEAEWQRLADEDPRKNAKQLEELRKAMNERAHELAKAKKQAERERVLGGDAVDDVPLEDLGLDEDAKFAELEAEQREVTKDPRKNAKRLQEVEQAMRDRARELADAAKWADRESYLDAYPEGVPLRAVPLDESPKFLEAEAQRRRLIEEDPRKNAKKIAELQQQLNDLAHELAKQKLWQDRKDNLDHNPEGMPLEGVGLDVDPEFRELEAEWQRLADEDPRKNAKQLEELRKAMNERAHELAKAKKQAERERVLGGDAVDDVPLEDLGLDEDAKFAELEAEQREVTKDPRKNAKRLQEVEQAMRDRARELADAAKWADRESYLDAYPEGVPLRAVPLDESPKFLEAEAQRRRLIEEDPRKNAKKIAELQKQLNDLAHELAKQKLWQDRKDNLDHNPEGMPLEGVGLDVDPEFRELEAEWQRLADEDPRKNAKQLEELRKAMNERAHELAKAKKQAERERVLGGDAVDDVPLEDLGLDEDAKFAELEAEQREVTKDPRKNAKRLQEVEQAMRDRARELADAAKWADRESYLDAYPEGVPLRAVPLDESPKFLEAEAQRRRLIEEDPRKNAKKIAELQQQLNDLAHELAKQKLWQDRKDNLDHNPEGMPLEGVGLDVDPEFRELEAEWQRLADEDPRKNAKQLEELRKAMNERAHELAKAKKQAERERVLGGDAVDDVPLEDLGLDEDAKFAELEAEQREVTKDPRKNAKRLQEVEQAMRDRARELADAAKWADRESYLDAYPEGVPLRAVPLDESPKFLEAEAQRRRLIEEDPRKNAKKIAELQQQLNDLAHELAKQKLWQDRKDNLDHNPEGMPLEGVGLDVDPEFRELEAEWQRLADEDPRKNAKQLEELRKAMNERAHELAKAKKQAERERVLGGDAVDDVPLEDLGLDEDAKFAELEAEQREVTKDPRKNAKRLQEVEQAMRDRARELADAAKWADRESYLDAYPEGVPLRAVPLDESPKFLEAEAQRRRLIEEDPRKNAKKIAELQKQLNDLAHELAKQKLWQDRKDNLDHNPEGMPLEGVGLDVDPEFRELEAEWQRLADEDPRKNAKQLEELRKAMNERAHELAKAKKQAERERVLGGDAVDDVPLEDLGLDEDAKFAELEAEQREVTKDPRKNAKRLQEVEQAMRDRARELADAAKWADRESYLDAYPEGVPLRAVPLDESPKFLEAEAQRRRLIEEDPRKNAKKIAELQQQLNDLAHELAKQKLWQDRKDNLDHNPEGMPLEGVGLDVDPEFRELEAEWQRLADEDPRKNAKQLEELRKAMNERAHELAKAKKQAERERVLGGDAVDDVPLEDLGLDEDAKFAELEAEQREVTKDPRKNAKRLQEVEQAMRDRARELADAAKWADRESYLDAYPEGVPLRAVPLDESPKFLEAEAQRRRLIEEDPRKNAKKIAELQKQLNDLAHELAKQKLWQDRKDNLDHNPEGMPLEGVGLDVDPEFRELEAEWQRLADEDPRKNAKQLEELRKAMNERAHELAKAKKQAERERVLGGDAVDDVPLEDLGLDEDAKFAELEAEQREVTKDPRKNAKRLQEVEQAMRDRARELADAAKWADRESYLDAYPEGVPLRAVPLDESPKFLEAEAQRRRLIEEDPRKNAKKIAELQKQLNDLAHELAKQKLWQDRKDNLDHNPEGMPLEGVGLDVDPEFRELEAEWQRLADEDPRKNAKQLEELRKAMNERAHELAKAKKQAERERVLGGDAVDDVPLEDLGLDEDAKFAELEAEQREVTKDPRKNAKRLQEVEQAMRDRARELADAAKWADRESYLDAYPEGVPLRAVPLDESPKFLEAEAQRRRLIEEDPRKNAKKIAELQQQLNDLAHELAKQKLWQDRKDNLDHNPEGMPLEGVGLDVDPEFRELEAEWQRLADEDPRKNAKQLEELRKAMNERAHELAKAKKQAERERVLGGDAVDDVPLEDLGLDEDAKFAELEAEQREVTKDPRKNAKRLQEVEQAMRDRARELADAAKWADRESYLDAYPEGVPLRAVPLDESPKFLEAEAQRRRLIEEDPRKNAKKIAELQKQLNDLAHELASEEKRRMRKHLAGYAPKGIDFRSVPLDNDPEFLLMEEEVAKLSANGDEKNQERLQALEELMGRRVSALGAAMLEAERAFLDQNPEGVSLSKVPLSDDSRFMQLEAERRRLIDADSQRNAQNIADLEDAMNVRSHELAKEVKNAAREFLPRRPDGVPMALVPVDNDSQFLDLEEELEDLREDSTGNRNEISSLEQRMVGRAEALARKYREAERDRVLEDSKPWRDVPVDTDAKFRALEDEHFDLMVSDPVRHADRIAQLEEAMRDRVRVLTDEKHDREECALRSAPGATGGAQNSRIPNRDYLDREPEGIPTDDVQLDVDAEFVAMEEELMKLREDPSRNAREIANHERCLNTRAHELAKKVQAEDLKYLHSQYHGIPTDKLNLHSYPEFQQLANKNRQQERAGRPPGLTQEEINDDMDCFARELAQGLMEDEYQFLSSNPEGVPLETLNVFEDPVFGQLDERRKRLNDSPRTRDNDEVKALEKKMNERVHQRAKDAKKKGSVAGVPANELDANEFPFLRDEYQGVPLEDVETGKDPQLSALLNELARQRKNPKASPKKALHATEEAIHKRLDGIAAEQLRRERAEYLPDEVHSVPLSQLPLNTDPTVNRLEHELRRAKQNLACPTEAAEIEKQIQERVEELADDYNRDRHKFLPEEPEGVPLEELGLSCDPAFAAMDEKLRRLEAADPRSEAAEDMRQNMIEHVHSRAKDRLHTARPDYVGSAPGGVPLEQLNDVLDGDPVFRALEAERGRLVGDPKKNAKRLRDIDKKLQGRAEEVGQAVRDDPNFSPDGVGTRPRQPYYEVKERVKKDVHEVVEPDQRGNGAYPVDYQGDVDMGVDDGEGWRDPDFYGGDADREDVPNAADYWPRIAELYPEGLSRPLLPEHPSPADVASPAGDLTYLAPFLAALSRQPPLLLRLFNTRSHSVNAPYAFVFFDPNSNPVDVEVDDRVPCDKDGNPRFTVSPSREWWPLLVEKAYAKYVGGYERMDDCTSHETLHDLTGRPVTHLPLEPKLAEEVPGCNYRDSRFWRDAKTNLDKGDVYIAVSNESAPDGIHSRCYYAVLDVFETVAGSSDPADVVVKVHNCYQDAPAYSGPLNARDPKWTARLRSVCGGANPAEEPELLYLPQPVFLRNFSSMQRCHISCGDRLTVSGEWDEHSSGGIPKYTTFRSNPIYLVENKGSRPATVLAELRHAAPVFYDASNLGVYHQTALALLRPESSIKFVAPLLAYNTHKFLQKGLLTDAREVCASLELPPNSTCYLVPYTKKKGSYGKYQLSVYPQEQPVSFTTLRPIEETHALLSTQVVARPGSGEGTRVDFSVSGPCDVHVLLYQDKITDPASVKRGNHLAEDEVMMAAYEDNTMLVASTGDASNAREHALTFQAPQAGRYTLLVGCPAKPVTGDCPVTVSVYTPKHTQCKWLPLPSAAAKQRVAPRLGLPPVRPPSGAAAATPNSSHRQQSAPVEPRRPASAMNGVTPRNPHLRGYSQ